MQIKYFQTAWNDVKNSPGWFGKMCLLALVNFIPIFGSIVSYGYLYGWAREIAWGVHQPMPASIFSNDDGKHANRDHNGDDYRQDEPKQQIHAKDAHDAACIFTHHAPNFAELETR